MSESFKERLEAYITSSAHLNKRHVHPRLARMFEMAGMTAVFQKAEGQYLWDTEGTRYLDLLAGGGVFFLGRNHPHINQTLKDVLDTDLPNLCIMNASVLGGVLAEKLIDKAGPHFGKVIFANTGTETTEVCIRFSRFVTRRRRFLYLEGAFHGRTYGAISMCGFPQMREGQDPMMPICTPLRHNDVAQLRRELKHGDVAAVFIEPVQGMTCKTVDVQYLREAEALCAEHGAILVVDEVQTGLGRTGDWFFSTAAGVRPGMMTVSKTLAGGQVPVAAVMISEDIYSKVYAKFTSGPFYFSTFAENNLAMAAGIATMEALEEMDAPAEAKRKGDMLVAGIEAIAEKYDVIDRIEGKGLMLTVYFKESESPRLMMEQKLLAAADKAAFGAAIHVDLLSKYKILTQIPGPGLNAMKILPPVIVSDEDIEYFLTALENVIAEYYTGTGPAVRLGRQVVNASLSGATGIIPASLVPPALARGLGTAASPTDENK
jgi:ornithine--oxo-acid transaminase